jgi:DNA-binding NtrC family response regulator
MRVRKEAFLQEKMKSQLKLMVVDDDINIGDPLCQYLVRLDYHVVYCQDPTDAVKRLGQENFDVVITDLHMPGLSGIDLIRKVKEISFETEVIVITGYGTMETAIESLRAGAADFLNKPFGFEDLNLSIQKTVRLHQLAAQNLSFKERIDRAWESQADQLGSDSFVGDSPAVVKIRKMIMKAVRAPETPVLLTGESGTGKELAANLIHAKGSRSDGPFISVNCSGFTPTLIEAEIFGHEKGAFTGAEATRKGVLELADHGTLFLDEIGEMPTHLQSRLLRVIEEKVFRRVGGQRSIRVDFRLISATNQDLASLVSTGAFRKDLYFRLNLFEINLPPLRGRKTDIELLIRHYLGAISKKLRKPIEEIHPEAVSELTGYDFPGNVRELKNILERAIILCDGDRIYPHHLPIENPANTMPPEPALSHLNLADLEKAAIARALAESGGNKTRAAEMAGVSRYSFLRKMKKYNL